MVFGAILAGGIGSRMHMADMPKQFLPLGEKPIIIHTLEKFLTCTKFDAIYVGVHPDYVEYMKDLVKKFLSKCGDSIFIINGGKDRNSTIFNIVDEIEKMYGDDPDNIIVTHDAVRPFVSLRIIEENIEGASKYSAVDTVIPAVDTIVKSDEGDIISDIPDRRFMYQGQTPQSFKISLLKDMFGSLSEEEKNILTDACKICVVRNYPVHLIMGDVVNLKITTPGDYKIAQAILGGNSFD